MVYDGPSSPHAPAHIRPAVSEQDPLEVVRRQLRAYCSNYDATMPPPNQSSPPTADIDETRKRVGDTPHSSESKENSTSPRATSAADRVQHPELKTIIRRLEANGREWSLKQKRKRDQTAGNENTHAKCSIKSSDSDELEAWPGQFRARASIKRLIDIISKTADFTEALNYRAWGPSVPCYAPTEGSIRPTKEQKDAYSQWATELFDRVEPMKKRQKTSGVNEEKMGLVN